ncbi:DUF2207 domain-containing protein [Patescibacteria group bacterium]
MKKITSFVFGLLFFVFPNFVFAQDSGWVVEKFHSDITIAQDAQVTVVETIEANFGNLQKHGIYRIIPVKYKTKFGNNLDVRFSLVNITNQQGKSLKYSETLEGDSVKLKIGHPDILISGKQIYVVTYVINRVVTTPNEQAEFYWNVTGSRWPVPIFQSSATIYGPEKSVLNTICFTGLFGSSETNCQHTHNSSTAQFSSSSLSPGEGLTIATSLNQNYFNLPTKQQEFWWFVVDNWLYGSPVLVFLLMFWMYWNRGRDKRYKNIFSESGSETVPLFDKVDALMSFGPPKNLSAGEVGVLVDEKVHMRDITAVIIDLARKGFITIKDETTKGFFSKTNVKLINNKKSESNLLPFEVSVLDMLFTKSRKKEAKLNKLHSKAYSSLQDAQKQLYSHLTKEGYFSGNPQTVRGLYLVAGIVVMVIGSMLASTGFGSLISSGGGFFAAIVSGLIIVFFSFFMPARTPKGRKTLKDVVGLKEWIRIGAWREQIHEKNNFIEEVLPYTIAFGMTKKFINALKDSELKNMDWYQSKQPLTHARFAHAMDSLDNSVASGVSAGRPSASSGGSGFSSGGGFSGGGFGGGGGGSW